VSVREARDAGRIPIATVTTTMRTTVNTATPTLKPTSPRRGITVGVIPRRAGITPAARAAPIAEPASASSTLSASTTPEPIRVEGDVHGCVCVGHRDPRLQTANDAQVVLELLSGGRFEAEREPGVGGSVEEAEALWHDANDLGRLSIDLHRLADDVRSASKAS